MLLIYLISISAKQCTFHLTITRFSGSDLVCLIKFYISLYGNISGSTDVGADMCLVQLSDVLFSYCSLVQQQRAQSCESHHWKTPILGSQGNIEHTVEARIRGTKIISVSPSSFMSEHCKTLPYEAIQIKPIHVLSVC